MFQLICQMPGSEAAKCIDRPWAGTSPIFCWGIKKKESEASNRNRDAAARAGAGAVPVASRYSDLTYSL